MEQFKKIEKFLNQHYDFQRNVIKERVEFKEKSMTRKQFKMMGDYDFYSIRRKLRMAKLNISMAELHSLFGSDFVKKYNPMEDYFNQLPA
ncbi:hypothetical protein [Nonlabens sp. Asnod3-A02]|uniref:hypothetical protein n=1 Tax=Nonlabens sp. Asnod3-A02 TaxID=3160579 RepID=UPI00386310E2